MKIDFLVTGGAGFIGSNIVRELVETGKSVRVLDNLVTGRILNIEDILDKIDFTEGDIRDADTAKKATEGVKNVLHLAALPSVARSVQDPVTSNDTNVLGALRMLIAARDSGVERFVFSSSSSVYGDTPILPKREDMFPMPLSPYAVQKLTGEHYCRIFHSLYKLNTFILRYFNVFGPRQNPASQYSAVIPLFIDALQKNKAPLIHGDGTQTRDFTFVKDVVAANICACSAPEKSAGDIYNVARGNRISINDLADTLIKIMKKNVKPVHDDPIPGDVKDSQANPAKAVKFLGWNPQYTFKEGLNYTVDYYTVNP